MVNHNNMKVDLEKLFKLFEEEENRRMEKYQSKIETMFIPRKENMYKLHYEKFKNKISNHKFGSTTKTGENLDSMIKCNISIEEAALVYMYTINMCFEVNSQLRHNKGRMDKDVFEYSEQLNYVLNKLPSYDNGIVYRDIKHPDRPVKSLLNDYKKNMNMNIIENAFISSHIENQQWREPKTDLRLIITTKDRSNGKDLRELSFNSDEKEVLFKKGTYFKVVDVNERNNIIELVEN